MRKRPVHMFSLISAGARSHLTVAMSLVAVIPLLSFAFVVFAAMGSRPYSVWIQIVICALALLIGLSGYFMLRQYPRHIERLKDYLRDIAHGKLPQEITLGGDMEDVSAIAKYLNTIVTELRSKVQELENQLALSQKMHETIQAQEKEILEAERHRVMIESLASACHHIGQPATVLRVHLDTIARSSASSEMQNRIGECLEAMDSIAEILHKLRNVSEYRTLPFQTYSGAFTVKKEGRILDIGGEK